MLMGGDETCLKWPLAEGESSDPVDDNGGRVVRFIDEDVGTSKGIFRNVRFSIAIEAPVAGIGAI